MSKRDDKTVDHSIKVLPNQAGYVAIPMPPRLMESTLAPRNGAISRIIKNQFRRRARAPLTRADRIRKRDLEQAFAIAVVANLLILVPILFITIKTPVMQDGPFVTLKPEDNDSANRSEPDVIKDLSGQVQVASSRLMEGAVTSNANDIEAVSLPTLDSQLNSMTFEAPPLSFGRSVENYEMGGIPGVDKPLLESLFPKSRFGNGSRLALFVDDSRSMRKINEAVASYVRTNFQHSFIQTVDNCKLRGAEDSFAVHFAHLALSSACNDFVFVCDLQDAQSEEGINFIRKFLIGENSVKRLHIISFDKRPRTHLSNLIESTGGSFTLIDRP